MGFMKLCPEGILWGSFNLKVPALQILLIKSQPTCFEDIVAINALCRPGPMNMIPSYLDRKKARVPVEYIFPELEPILKETYGIIVYQEQVQQIAVKVAGYSYGEADVLRRAMGKKIPSVMEKQKTRFLEGAKRKKYNLKKAEELFDLMAEFAKYGFNKSHAAAYCVLAAQTAWLKHYYPVEFLASQMTIEQNDSDKLVNYIRDAKKHGFTVLSPHINRSSFQFVIDEGKICFSLGAIKGLGIFAAKEIVRARQLLKDKRFSSIEEFFETVDLKKINKKTLESLIKSGALDGFGYGRKELFDNIEKFIHYAVKQKEDRNTGQQSLFVKSLEKENQIQILKTEPWSRKETLTYEKETFGFYLNDYPMKALEGLEKSLGHKTIAHLKQMNDTSRLVETLAMISNIKEVLTRKKAQLMAFALLENGSHSLKVTFFPEVYEKMKKLLLQKGEVFYITGRLQKDRRTDNQLVAEDVMPLDDFLKRVQKVKLQLYPDMERQRLLDLKNLLSNSKEGKAQICLQTYIPDQKAFVEIDTKATLHDIEINHDFLQKTRKIFKAAKNIHLYR